MRIVRLDGNALGEFLPVLAVFLLIRADDVLKSRRDEHILLLEPEHLAGVCLVVRIEDAGYSLDVAAKFHSRRIVAPVIGVHIEVFLIRLGGPEAESIDRVSSVSHNGYVVRHGEDRVSALPGKPVFSVLLVPYNVTAEADDDCVFRLSDLPGVPVFKPVVGKLRLTAVHYILVEKAVTVADSVSVAVVSEGRERIDEAGGEPSETAVSETGIRLLLIELVEVLAHILKSGADYIGDAEIHQIVFEQPADKKLHREIIDLLCLFRAASLHRLSADASCL